MTPEKESLLAQIHHHLEELLARGITNGPDSILQLENEITGMLTQAYLQGVLTEIPVIHVVENPVDPSGLLILDEEEYRAYLESYPKVK